MKKIFLIIFLAISLDFSGQGISKLEYKKGVGFSVGHSIGYGFTYKTGLFDRLNLQLTVLPPVFYVHSQPDSATKSGVNIFSSGITFSYDIYKTSKLREYAYVGSFYHYLSGYFFGNDGLFVVEGGGGIVGAGFGLGMEFFTDCVGLNFYLGEAYSQRFWEEDPDHDAFHPDFKGNINFGVSVLYYFR